MAASLRKRRLRPRALVPNEKSGTPDEASVAAPFDDERADVIFLPTPHPLGDHFAHMLPWHNLPAEELHHGGIREQFGC